VAQKVKNPCHKLYNNCRSTFIKENLFLTFKCKLVHKCFVAVNSKISSLKKLNKKWQTNFGQCQKMFWAKGPNFGVEVIVSVHCVLNCWPLRLWFPKFSETPYMTGSKWHIISELWVYFKSWGSPGFNLKTELNALVECDHMYSDIFLMVVSFSQGILCIF